MSQVIKVFLASPGDVIEERLAVRTIFEEENRNHFNHAGYNLEVVGWETHASPGKGQPHPQGRINPLIDDCELFIGIIGARFSSATGRSESGTQEEYEYALSILANPDLPLCDIKIYFYDYSLKHSQVDPEQLTKVREFKKKLEEGKQISYWTVDTLEEFKREFRRHISEWFREYRERGGGKRLSTIKSEETIAPEESLSLRFRAVTKGF